MDKEGGEGGETGDERLKSPDKSKKLEIDSSNLSKNTSLKTK